MGLIQYFIIVPNADEAGVASATGFTFTSPLYTAADPAPRTATHKWIGTPFTPAQETAIETPVTGARAVFTDSVFEQYNRKTQPGFPQQRIAELGLTTNPDA